MKLADKSFMNETRYSQSFGDFGSRKNKLLSTGFTNNTMNTTTRLPKLSRSLSSSNTKSALQRVDIVSQNTSELNKNLTELKMETRESRRYVNFIKEDLAERFLNEHKNQLQVQIKKLENAFKFSQKTDEDRTNALKKNCTELNSASKQIIDMVQSLRIKIDRLEQTMGIYSGKEKHKF